MPKANVNGINIAYDVDGQGEPLVLIMGFNSSRKVSFFQKRAFSKYFQVITFDNRGFGGSDKPNGPYSIRMMADDAVGLMNHINIEKAHILGVSMGGMIAQELAINYPEKMGKLILWCTYAQMDETSGWTSEFRKSLGLDVDCSHDDWRNVPIKDVTNSIPYFASNSWLFKLISIAFFKVLSIISGLDGVDAQWQAMIGHDTLDRLHMIQAPTLIIAGTEDNLIKPSSSDVLASNIPNSRLIMVTGGSHMIVLGKRSRFNKEALDFLRDS